MSGLSLSSIALVITLVIAAIAVVHHASVRSSQERAAESAWILDVVLALQIAVYAWLTLEPRTSGAAEINLIPLTDLAPTFQDWFTNWLPEHGLTQVPPQVMLIAADFLLLAPFAAVAPLRFAWLRSGGRVFLVAAGIAAVGELLQGVLARGHGVSFDDILVQALGALTLYAMTRGALNARTRRLAAIEAREADRT